MTGTENAFPAEPSRVPPRLDAPTNERRVFWMIGGVGALGMGLVLYLFNPALNGFFPRCFLYELTGLLCPGCGGLRATHQLLHGHVFEALRLNALFVVSIPVVALLGCWKLLRREGVVFKKPMLWLWITLTVVTIFTVLRNLSAFAWLAP